MLTKEVKNRLSKIFYSPSFGLRNARSLYLKSVKEGLGVSYGEVKSWYANQEVVQRFAPLQKPDREHKIKIDTVFPAQRVYFDTTFYKPYKFYVVVALDLAPRFVWAKPVYVKHTLDDTKTSVNSAQSAKLLQAVYEDLASRGYHLTKVVCSGSEFTGNFYDLAKKLEVVVEYTEPNDHRALAPVDGFCRTLRVLVEKWVASHETTKVFETVTKLVEGYNNSPHSSLGLTASNTPSSPLDYLTSKKLQAEKEARYYARQKLYSRLNKPTTESDLKVGNSVRVLTRFDKNPFRKIRPNWSKEIYSVSKLQGRKFLVSNGKAYRRHELLPIPRPELVEKRPRTPPPPQVPKKVVATPKEPVSSFQPRRSQRLAEKSKQT